MRREVWEWVKEGTRPRTKLLSPLLLLPCPKVKVGVSEGGHFLCPPLCSQAFPLFHLLDKQSRPKEWLSEEQKLQILLLFSPSQCHQYFTHWQKSENFFSLKPDSISELCVSFPPARPVVAALLPPEAVEGQYPRCPASALPGGGWEIGLHLSPGGLIKISRLYNCK